MDYPKLSFWLMFILNFLVSLTTPQPILAYYGCSTSGNYTTNSTYAANLKDLLSSIPTSSDLNSDGFFSTSIGQSPNQVYATGLCRGGQNVTSCRSCLNNSVLAITQLCPNQKEASGGYDGCRLMFSDHNILDLTEYYLLYFRCNGNRAGNMAQFNDVLGNLLFSLRDQAAVAPRKYAVDEANYTIFQNIYGLAQCMPDVSEADCRRCLDMARIDMTNNCSGSIGVISARYSCQLQYELNEFYQPPGDGPLLLLPPSGTPAPPQMQSPPPLSTNTSGGGDNNSKTIIIIAVPTACTLLIVILICLFLSLRKRKKNVESKFNTKITFFLSLKIGYMAPEYVMQGQFSVKSDVFSFGVLVLEIVSGQKNNCFGNGENVEDLLSYAWKNWSKGMGSHLIDLALRAESGSIRDIIRCIHIGLLCVQENVASRPTMASVVLMLNSFSITLPMPSEPAFFVYSSADPTFAQLSEYGLGARDSKKSTSGFANFSNNEASISDLHPR
ncbi:hypothetical protein RJ639_030169 [Escallonia herrerae]|uniref:Gnk2-homologous domain-containing protein n=1 Tax=Escallonia herrerae TaxID=1293975 RepID=A0AA88X006_9ASTE|nr:hypothetical protein RJ639_030169 [Escallonia herrerae]